MHRLWQQQQKKKIYHLYHAQTNVMCIIIANETQPDHAPLYI